MGLKRTDAFRKDTVRIALASGLARRQVADDLGGYVDAEQMDHGASHCPGSGLPGNHERGDTNVVSKEDLSLAQENDRLRRENRVLKEERDILKNRSGLGLACAR